MDTDFIVVDEAPKGLQWYRYMDLAIGRTSRSDFNATPAVAHDPKTGLLYIRDMIRIIGHLGLLDLRTKQSRIDWMVIDTHFPVTMRPGGIARRTA